MTTPYDEGHDTWWEITEQPPEPGPAWNVHHRVHCSQNPKPYFLKQNNSSFCDSKEEKQNFFVTSSHACNELVSKTTY